ncbi:MULTISPECIES: winged helix-turn-helix transcriptional regulator [Microbacterium]|uniref:Helix-turn-helix domain-containing protein n=1 Tax=Microbacterium schleiferi TaxID=69362 RepID=A0ABU7V4Q4_9MICO|nr:helix-turn-helix domain-containing protein [Microbacterium sp. 67-17]MBD3751178.1 helix-turn-helix transcriptional regulator [Micrococcales bacterium]OJW01479.1 MAG: transcriptional regulator [Microbacterium sp. 67-17]
MSVSLAEIRDVRERAFSAACPTRVVLDHVMSKWGVLVLLTLGDGTARWGELRRSIDGISEKMLATTLKTLEGDGLVQRTSYPEVPPRVEYSLTELGCDLMLRLGPLMDWVAEHAGAMVDREQSS